jgi:hypothetical protein
MKLWRAMVKGSKIRKQVTGAYFINGGSCALGAAYEGAGLARYEDGNRFSLEIANFNMADSIAISRAPCGDMRNETLYPVITHLNDAHCWTREAIAEWVKTIEDERTRTKWAERKEVRLGAKPAPTEPQTREATILEGVTATR